MVGRAEQAHGSFQRATGRRRLKRLSLARDDLGQLLQTPGDATPVVDGQANGQALPQQLACPVKLRCCKAAQPSEPNEMAIPH